MITVVKATPSAPLLRDPTTGSRTKSHQPLGQANPGLRGWTTWLAAS